MKSMRELLTEFSEMGSRHNFLMNSGQECEGWIVSVEDDHVLFVDSDSTTNKDEIKVRFGAIDIGSLVYRDDEQRSWIGVRWNDDQQHWEHSVLSQDEEPELVLTELKREPKIGKLTRLLKPMRPSLSFSKTVTRSALTPQASTPAKRR